MRSNIDARQIDLVERHDDRHTGRTGVADGFFGLRHDAVVGGDDQHGDIGDVGAASPHFGEGFVTRRIDEGDLAGPILFDFVGANVLRDAAAFAADHVDADDLVQQRRLAVVDVTQERDDRRARLEHFWRIGLLVEHAQQLIFQTDGLPQLDFDAKFNREHFDRFLIDCGADRGFSQLEADVDQLPQDLRCSDADRFGKAANRGRQLENDLAFARSGGAPLARALQPRQSAAV